MSYIEISNNFINIFKKNCEVNLYANQFIQQGLPNNKRNESWKHSPTSLFPLTPIFESFDPFSPCSSNLNKKEKNKSSCYTLIFTNNRLNLAQSNLPKHFEIKKSEAQKDISNFETSNDPIVNLTKANCKQEVNIIISSNYDRPLEILFEYEKDLEDNTWASTVLNFTINNNISFHLITRHIGKIDSLSTIFNFDLQEASTLHHLNLIETSNRMFSNCLYHQEADSNLNIFSISQSTPICRQNIEILLEGKNTYASANGLIQTSNDQHCDVYTLMRHNHNYTTSSQLFKCIAKDRSRAIYNGRVIIERNCHNSNSSQLSKNIIKDKTARIYSRPQLEVYNDDVSCSHGSTFGQLSEDELFYLISRGINKAKAEEMLQEAFLSEAINQIKSNDLLTIARSYILNHG